MSKNSPPTPEDRRIRRTKKLIWEALLTLLQEQTFASSEREGHLRAGYGPSSNLL